MHFKIISIKDIIVYKLIMISFLFIVKSSFGIEQYTAHGGPVKGLAVSTNNQLMASASFDYSVVIWDLNPIKEKIITVCFLLGLDLKFEIVASLIVEKTGVSFFTWSLACSTCFESSVTTALIISNSASNLFFSLITKEFTEFKFESVKYANFDWISSKIIFFSES